MATLLIRAPVVGLIITSKQHVFHHQTPFTVKDAEVSDAEIVREFPSAEYILGSAALNFLRVRLIS